MNRTFFSLYNDKAAPCREQNLFISHSKHLYCLADGTLKYQKKELDPRIPGKKLLTRFVLLDVDTGFLYGECHEKEYAKDLAGFLARAWIRKPMHVMHGIPSVLNVPTVAFKDDNYRADLELLSRTIGLRLGDLPSGFSAGVHAVRQFESAVQTLLWSASGRSPATLDLVQACSGLLSAEASGSMSHLWKEKWSAIPPAPDVLFTVVDGLYDEIGAWRKPPFDLVLNGLPDSET